LQHPCRLNVSLSGYPFMPGLQQYHWSNHILSPRKTVVWVVFFSFKEVYTLDVKKELTMNSFLDCPTHSN